MKKKNINKINRYVELSKQFESQPNLIKERIGSSISLSQVADKRYMTAQEAFSHINKVEDTEKLMMDAINHENIAKLNLVKDWFEYKRLQEELLEL